MKVFRNIKSALAYFLVIVVFAASMTTNSNAHACCPENLEAAEEHTVTLHFQHLNVGAAEVFEQGMVTYKNNDSMTCDISCCANVTSNGITTLNLPVLALNYQTSVAFSPTSDVAISAAANIHTPPPRIS